MKKVQLFACVFAVASLGACGHMGGKAMHGEKRAEMAAALGVSEEAFQKCKSEHVLDHKMSEAEHEMHRVAHMACLKEANPELTDEKLAEMHKSHGRHNKQM
jgi:hypothetical protein